MRKVNTIILLAFFECAHGKESVENPVDGTQDTIDRLVDGLADKLLNRVLNMRSSENTEMDSTMLAKPGRLSTLSKPGGTMPMSPMTLNRPGMTAGPGMTTGPLSPLSPSQDSQVRLQPPEAIKTFNEYYKYITTWRKKSKGEWRLYGQKKWIKNKEEWLKTLPPWIDDPKEWRKEKRRRAEAAGIPTGRKNWIEDEELWLREVYRRTMPGDPRGTWRTYDEIKDMHPKLKNAAWGYLRYLQRNETALQLVINAEKSKNQAAEQARLLEQKTEESEVLAKRLSGLTLTTRVKTDDSGTMFASIDADDIVKLLAVQGGISIDAKTVQLDAPIKKLGDQEISLKLPGDVDAKFTLKVEEGEEDPSGKTTFVLESSPKKKINKQKKAKEGDSS